MKKLTLLILAISLGLSAMAQTSIQFRSIDRAECTRSDFSRLEATFSFSSLNFNEVNSERGSFSELTMPNTYYGGNEGDPQIPVINELIAIPQGAKPSIRVKSYSSTDYRLADYGINRLSPRQPSLRKDQKAEDQPFKYNEAAYQQTGLAKEPAVTVNISGTMRGVTLGSFSIEPVSYDALRGVIRVFNDIEVEVVFEEADMKATEDLLVQTYSPYFGIVYKQLFNNRAILDAYSQHPDLYTTPVKMLVITTPTYASSTPFQEWLTWKKQKGIYVDVCTTTETGTTSSSIRSFIQNKYNTDHPTFLVIVGDKQDITSYTTYTVSGLSYNPYDSDLQYASIDNDVYHDMFMSRMPISSTTELGNLVNKILEYEKYTMPDPSYLDNVLLIAGYDGTWANKVGRPTINYAADNYFNAAHGFANVYKYVTDNYTGCYNYLSSGVGFANYTAHGDITMWYQPQFTVSNVSSLTNTDKYFWAMGNCCLAANWGYSTTTICLGEALLRAANKGAFGYIGSIPESYWWEDYYFGVGATSVYNSTPAMSATTTGVYDAMFDDTGFNTLNSVPYIGNVAVTYAHAGNYSYSVTDEYYWRAYQCLGDGSVMPYHTQPSANNVSHANVLPIGADSFSVSAVPGSYVAITMNNEIMGTAQVGTTGTVNVPITPATVPGSVMIVVTRQQRQPYITTIQAVGGTQYTITASANPTQGGQVEGAGTYYENTTCTLTATANRGYHFDYWKKNNNVVSTSPTYSFTVTAGGAYVANFHALNLHTVTCATVEHGSISADMSTAYPGETVALTAIADEGYCFAGWDVRDAANQPVTVTDNEFVMPDSDVTVSASFLPGRIVTLASMANGSISANLTCALPGTPIVLTAVPNANYVFGSWTVFKTGDVSTMVTVTDDSFEMPDYDVTVTAHFIAQTSSTVTIGSGSTTSPYFPTYIYYKYSFTEQIYTPGELGAAGTITSIAFRNSNTNTDTRNLDVYMTHTSKTSFSGNYNWENMNSTQLVFSGNVNFVASNTNQGWTVITLDTPFEYDGSSNLLIGVDDNTGTYPYNYPSFYVYSTNANRAIYVYNDYTNYDPSAMGSIQGTTFSSNNQIKVTKLVAGTSTSITVMPDVLSGFTYAEENGPSEVQGLNLVCQQLESYLSISAPAEFEVSTSATGSFSGTLSLSPTNGAVVTNLYVRMKAGLLEGVYRNKILNVSSGSVSRTITLNGEVTPSGVIRYDIAATVDPEDAGSVSGTGNYIEGTVITLTATATDGYYFVNWTENNEVISEASELVLTVEANRSFVAHFGSYIQQSVTLSAGWNWFSFPIEIDDDELLPLLEESLNEAGNLIKSQDAYLIYDDGWEGSLSGVDHEHMFQILVQNACDLIFTGLQIQPESHPVTINPGWNWIGYPSDEALDLATALGDFQPQPNDIIKSRAGFSTYIEGYGWWGTLNTLIPGEGYMYMSRANAPSVLFFRRN